MAIIQNTALYRGYATGVSLFTFSPSGNLIKIYQTLGNMPADADDYLEANHTADLLVTFGGWTFVVGATPTNADDVNWGRVEFGTFPNPSVVNGTGTGVAAWYAMYNAATEVILGEVSTPGGSPLGSGSLQIDNLSIVNGSPVQILDWAIIFKA